LASSAVTFADVVTTVTFFKEPFVNETATATDLTDVATDAPIVQEALVEQDLLVEDVSIDGMCGVY
jgi:mycofactocin precursor